MQLTVSIIFFLTYLGIAVGRVPRLKLDRTGIALVGAVAMIVCGTISIDKAMGSIDVPTILLLYALMIVSAQLRLGGFYTWVAFRITFLTKSPRLFLLATMTTSAGLSAILANDIICLAFTPVLASVLPRQRLNPMPFLIGLAVASNIGSAATIIGNPQNMLLGQMGHLRFDHFFYWCAPPAILALIGSYFLLCFLYHGVFNQNFKVSDPDEGKFPKFNQWQSIKGLIATGILMALFFTSVPREFSAIAVAGVLLCSRKMQSRHILQHIDWHLITLFCSLFIVIHAAETNNIPAVLMETLRRIGIDVRNLMMLTGISTVLSNLVSNVPATMLLLRFIDASNPVEWYTLAVSSTFAGNFIVIGSIANLIVIEQASRHGIEISFKEHAKVGIPVTLFSLLVLIFWIYV